MSETTLEARLLTEEDFKSFSGVYKDFRQRAFTDYNFELEPLDYEGFTDAVKENFIKCIALYEDNMPVGFLVYTDLISEAIELNIIHFFNLESSAERLRVLVKKFLELTKEERAERVVCYPMLGAQKTNIGEIARYGFKFVGIVVLRFMMDGTNSREILKLTHLTDLNPCYTLVPWDEIYTKDAVEIIKEAFETSADALFDPRFKTLDGTYDIVNKVTKDIYAEFLPEASSVLLCNNLPAGVCFMNLTGGTIANVPIVAIKKDHQGKGLSKHLLKHSLDRIIEWVENGKKPITEINTTTETNNFQALKMYRHLGFKEDYNYPQAYLPVK